MYDIISVGDATLDTFVKIKEASVIYSPDKSRQFLCLSYGDKIPIESLDQQIAGNAANNAIGSARLGLKAAFYSVVGDDETGGKIKKKMKEEGVSLEYLKVDKGKPSNYSVVLNFNSERTILIYHLPRVYSLPKFSPTKWIYYTSVGKNHIKLNNQIVRFVKKNGVKLGYNPGTFQIARGLESMKPLLEVCEVLFVNREEAESLVGRHVGIKPLLEKLYQQGPKIVVITDGHRGSYAYDGKNFWSMGIFPVKVVEMTGAGDAYSTGFMASIVSGNSLSEAMRWGTANSASVITKVGPQAGLLHKNEMREWLKRYARIKPELL